MSAARTPSYEREINRAGDEEIMEPLAEARTASPSPRTQIWTSIPSNRR